MTSLERVASYVDAVEAVLHPAIRSVDAGRTVADSHEQVRDCSRPVRRHRPRPDHASCGGTWRSRLVDRADRRPSRRYDVGWCRSGTSAEQVNLTSPTAGTYTVWVHGWQTDGPDANFTLSAWNLGPDAANATVTAPAAATVGEATIGVSWAGLGPARYLGAVSHNGPSGLLALTVVSVDAR